MSVPNTSKLEIRELGGEPLEGSGFEDESPSSALEPFEQITEEAPAQ